MMKNMMMIGMLHDPESVADDAGMVGFFFFLL